MTLKAAKMAMDMQYDMAKVLVLKYGHNGVEIALSLMDKMEGVVDACIYSGKSRVWRLAQKYSWELHDKFWAEVVEA